MFNMKADSAKLSFSQDWKLQDELEQFKCIALIKISLWCATFSGVCVYIYIYIYLKTYIHNEIFSII